MEMGDTPIVDNGAYVMLGNDELFLQLLAERRAEPKRDHRLRRLDAARHARRSASRSSTRAASAPSSSTSASSTSTRPHVHWQVTPRQVVAHAGARAARTGRAASAARPRQQPRRARQRRHRRWRPSTRSKACRSTSRTCSSTATAPKGRRSSRRRALQLAEAVNANPNVSASTSARSCSARPSPPRATPCASMRNASLAQPAQMGRRRHRMRRRLRRGAVPLPRRRASSTRCNGRSGWRSSCCVKRPVARVADHRPSERRAVHQLPAPDPAADGPQLSRRAAGQAPSRRGGALRAAVDRARILAVRDRDHDARRRRRACWACATAATWASGAAADIAVYRDARRPRGDVRDARVRVQGRRAGGARRRASTATPVGGTHVVEPDFDRGIEKTLRRHFDAHGAVDFDHVAIGRDELCRCGNGGRLLPAACFETSRMSALDASTAWSSTTPSPRPSG